MRAEGQQVGQITGKRSNGPPALKPTVEVIGVIPADEPSYPSPRLFDRAEWLIRHGLLLFSREEIDENGEISDNWRPCPREPAKVFSGTDFLFAAAIALDLIPR